MKKIHKSAAFLQEAANTGLNMLFCGATEVLDNTSCEATALGPRMKSQEIEIYA